MPQLWPDKKLGLDINNSWNHSGHSLQVYSRVHVSCGAVSYEHFSTATPPSTNVGQASVISDRRASTAKSPVLPRTRYLLLCTATCQWCCQVGRTFCTSLVSRLRMVAPGPCARPKLAAKTCRGLLLDLISKDKQQCKLELENQVYQVPLHQSLRHRSQEMKQNKRFKPIQKKMD